MNRLVPLLAMCILLIPGEPEGPKLPDRAPLPTVRVPTPQPLLVEPLLPNGTLYQISDDGLWLQDAAGCWHLYGMMPLSTKVGMFVFQGMECY